MRASLEADLAQAHDAGYIQGSGVSHQRNLIDIDRERAPHPRALRVQVRGGDQCGFGGQRHVHGIEMSKSISQGLNVHHELARFKTHTPTMMGEPGSELSL